MSSELATRCPACHTVFRVVPDQLRVSAGWVRCGRCAEVFNANESLVGAAQGAALDASPPVSASPPPLAPQPPSPAQAPQPAPSPVPSPVPPPASEPDLDWVPPQRMAHHAPHPASASAVFQSARSLRIDPPVDDGADETPTPLNQGSRWEHSPTPGFESKPAIEQTRADAAATGAQAFAGAATASSSHVHAAPPSREPAPQAPAAAARSLTVPTAPTAANPPQEALIRPSDRSSSSGKRARSSSRYSSQGGRSSSKSGRKALAQREPALDEADDGQSDELKIRAPEPSFVRQANRAARWQSPAARIGLGAACLVATLALAAQAAYQFRDEAAARWPIARAPLQKLCAWAGCVIAPMRAIRGVAVESVGLARLERSGNLYKLSVGLRNQKSFEVAQPALELSLTDGSGKVVAKRVLSAQELGAPANGTLPANGELQLQGTLALALTQVDGYTIEVFYP